jgi:hypothetical protein
VDICFESSSLEDISGVLDIFRKSLSSLPRYMAIYRRRDRYMCVLSVPSFYKRHVYESIVSQDKFFNISMLDKPVRCYPDVEVGDYSDDFYLFYVKDVGSVNCINEDCIPIFLELSSGLGLYLGRDGFNKESEECLGYVRVKDGVVCEVVYKDVSFGV